MGPLWSYGRVFADLLEAWKIVVLRMLVARFMNTRTAETTLLALFWASQARYFGDLPNEETSALAAQMP